MDYSVIKEDDVFLTTEKNGDILAGDQKGYGLYTQDTRFLSQFELKINGKEPSLLSSNDDKNYIATIRLVENKEDVGAVEAVRERFIHQRIFYERVTFTNYFLEATQVEASVSLDADFQDMFIVRQFKSGEVGKLTGHTFKPGSMMIGYQGKDDTTRETVIEWDSPANHISSNGTIHFTLELEPQQQKAITFTITPVIAGACSKPLPYEEALGKLEASYQNWIDQGTKIESDLPVFDEVFKRGAVDTRMLMTDVGFGSIPVAGVPWFSVPFGRDSLITSLFMLPYRSDQVKGTLRTLAHYQGKEERPERDEQPGKIMHEIRFGELAKTGQIPFTPYYGTVDATPLFIVLASEYYNWTGDLEFILELKPAINAAFSWMDHYGNIKDDGFIQYAKTSEDSFINQGWKDSDNSNVHQNGTLAEDPISLAEVQGYVYQAKQNMAEIYRKLGDEDRAGQLEEEALSLQERFEKAFWMEEEQFYALALDGDSEPVQAITSNPGHVLMSGMLSEERVKRVAEVLTGKPLFNGYGVRTMSSESVGYYPMSYHNGSVWPHDNAMILLGLIKTGRSSEALTIVKGMLEAAQSFENLRLPELFCGHDKEIGYLVPYPTTCSPQAWAAASSFVFLQAVIGVNPDAAKGEVTVNPAFLENMNEIKVEGMRAGGGAVSLKITRSCDEYNVEVLENTSGWTVRQA
ncbi:amylo-alpha-1,6-glucosidase [Halobacillus sp. Marseille-Q1614]|uniref:amylo-alpha-1,6-glucosidase n=1 Tax=Halobacillus sp. Marseille-Q1614 TaxID=2709134 RepID=UPI0015714129|nr:amylo-alpha-1,6-glucosidase [Halobacillus sp. Marseille-Q1614]